MIRPLGEGKVSTLFDYQPGRLVARREVRETLACRCGEGVITALAVGAVLGTRPDLVHGAGPPRPREVGAEEVAA